MCWYFPNFSKLSSRNSLPRYCVYVFNSPQQIFSSMNLPNHFLNPCKLLASTASHGKKFHSLIIHYTRDCILLFALDLQSAACQLHYYPLVLVLKEDMKKTLLFHFLHTTQVSKGLFKIPPLLFPFEGEESQSFNCPSHSYPLPCHPFPRLSVLLYVFEIDRTQLHTVIRM